jgi:hypothetical protein
MKYVVPENVGGSDLRVLPEDTYEAEVQDIFFGLSGTNNPKATIKLVVQSEYSGRKDADFQTCVGETILETVSLQPQAMWKINDWYKGATGEPRIPEGEYDDQQFESMLKEALVGARFNVLVETKSTNGNEMTVVKKFSAIQGKKVGGKKIRR